MGVARRWSAPTDKKKREQRLFFQFKEKISSIAFFWLPFNGLDFIQFQQIKTRKNSIEIQSHHQGQTN